LTAKQVRRKIAARDFMTEVGMSFEQWIVVGTSVVTLLAGVVVPLVIARWKRRAVVEPPAPGNVAVINNGKGNVINQNSASGQGNSAKIRGNRNNITQSN
jgi:hypothetical protein